MGDKRIAPLNPNLDARRWWVFSATSLPLHPLKRFGTHFIGGCTGLGPGLSGTANIIYSGQVNFTLNELTPWRRVIPEKLKTP
jgi:hypothetical protein